MYAVDVLCSQLRYDGYESVASSLVKSVAGNLTTCAPSSRLAHIVNLGQKAEGESKPETGNARSDHREIS